MNESKIAERVKFWQEQDRINRELIPRVIKGHELLTRHVESHEDGDSLARAQIELLQTRMVESYEAAKSQIESLQTQMAESHETSKARIDTLEARVAELETRWANKVSRWLPYAALALAVVALVLALVR